MQKTAKCGKQAYNAYCGWSDKSDERKSRTEEKKKRKEEEQKRVG